MARSKLQQDIKDNNLTITPTEQLRKLIKRKQPIIVTSLQDVKLLIARTLLLLQKEDITPVNAKAIIYCCNVYASVVKEADLERRLAELENKLGLNKLELNL